MYFLRGMDDTVGSCFYGMCVNGFYPHHRQKPNPLRLGFLPVGTSDKSNEKQPGFVVTVEVGLIRARYKSWIFLLLYVSAYTRGIIVVIIAQRWF